MERLHEGGAPDLGVLHEPNVRRVCLDDMSTAENRLPLDSGIGLYDLILIRLKNDEGDASVLTRREGSMVHHISELVGPSGKRIGLTSLVLPPKLAFVHSLTELVARRRVETSRPERSGKYKVCERASMPPTHELCTTGLDKVLATGRRILHKDGNDLELISLLSVVIDEVCRY